jgi:periplasmic divalent cation tolerance protein
MTEPDETVVVVLSTAPDGEAGARIASALVAERWIACASLLPGVTSVYRWQDQVKTDAEVLMVMKTPRRLAEGAVRRLAELHPYQVPEALVLPVEGGLPAYLRWVHDETGTAPAQPPAAPNRANESEHAP